jgi:hypothetical protein
MGGGVTRTIVLFLCVTFAVTLVTPTISQKGGNFTNSVSVAMQTATGNVYYVAANGNDSNPGTEAQPFRTMKRGASSLKPGDTLYVKNGTYVGSSQLRGIPSGSTWSAPVTIAAYPGHRPTIVAEPRDTALYFVGNHYIIIDGFIIDAAGGGGDGIKITYETGVPTAHHIRIKNSEIKNADGQGIGVGSEFNEFINLNVHHNGLNCFEAGKCHGIYIATNNNLVHGGTWHNNESYGVHLYSRPDSRSVGPSNNIVRNALVYNNGSVGIGVVHGADNHVYNNVVYRNKRGIWVLTTDGVINNNMVYNNPDGGISVGYPRNTISNNIIYSNGNGLEVYPHDRPVSGVIIKNNIAAKNVLNFADSSKGGVSAKGNLFGDAYDPRIFNLSGQE